jgi:RNA polymerase sigma factor (sigma-70 family)
MTKFNPDFWEITISAESWARFSTENRLWNESNEDAAARHARAERAESFWPVVRAVMEEVLTERQREVAMLYFFERLNQRQIGERLGISQQAVGEHLHGKCRNGHMSGGILPKLRKACAARGVRWE